MRVPCSCIRRMFCYDKQHGNVVNDVVTLSNQPFKGFLYSAKFRYDLETNKSNTFPTGIQHSYYIILYFYFF